MFDYMTAGESHGPELTAIIKNPPSGLEVKRDKINKELTRRQKGYGRGERMDIEKDEVKISSGVRKGKTLGTPITLKIENKDWSNWKKTMAVFPSENEGPDKKDYITKPRPGHADLPGVVKYNFTDIRNALERASARETAIRTAIGAICKQFLSIFNIKIYSHVIQIGSIKSKKWEKIYSKKLDVEKYFKAVEKSHLRCKDEERTAEMMNLIDEWAQKGESAGGVFEIIVTGLPIGLGSYNHWDERLDGKLSAALMGIPAIKGIELGAGFSGASLPGSKVHDPIYYKRSKGYYRSSNQAGGLEGGISNGESLVLRLAMKPIPTLAHPLHSVDIETREDTTAARERADICAVPSASIVGEAVTAIVVAKSFAKKFGGDNMEEIKRNYKSYLNYLSNF